MVSQAVHTGDAQRNTLHLIPWLDVAFHADPAMVTHHAHASHLRKRVANTSFDVRVAEWWRVAYLAIHRTTNHRLEQRQEVVEDGRFWQSILSTHASHLNVADEVNGRGCVSSSQRRRASASTRLPATGLEADEPPVMMIGDPT
jgi:hypothetical protein